MNKQAKEESEKTADEKKETTTAQEGKVEKEYTGEWTCPDDQATCEEDQKICPEGKECPDRTKRSEKLCPEDKPECTEEEKICPEGYVCEEAPVEEVPEEKAEEPEYKSAYADDYWELLLLGAIDGFASNFNVDCSKALTTSVVSIFDVFENIGIYDPRKIGKFQIANVNFTEGTNSVYAHCDMNQLVQQFTWLADYENYEQYIVFASRIGGVFINEFWEKEECISHGNKIDNGYDVGFCSFQLVSAFLDTEL